MRGAAVWMLAFVLMATPMRAGAVVIEGPDGGLVILPPPVPGGDPLTAKQMLGQCMDNAMHPENARDFTPDEFASNISHAMRMGRLIKSGVMQPTESMPSAESWRDLAAALEECRMQQNVKRSSNIAMLSCDAMFEEMWAIDKEGEMLFKSGRIFRPDWVHALESLLPAAQMCRNQLGSCYNPAKPTQKHVVDILMSFSILLDNASNGQTRINFKLPACTPTWLAEDENPNPYKMQLIDYLNLTVDDEFVSIGGQTRPPPPVTVSDPEP